MTTITSLFSRLILALALTSATGAAMAAPVSYHVTLDTSAFSGNGYLDLSFGGIDTQAGPATAVVSNVTGAVTGTSDVIGVVNGDLTGTASFNNAQYGDLAQLVQFGGMFGFDVLFDFADMGTGSSFAIGLLDTAFGSILGTSFAAQINVTPGEGTAFATFTPFATVALNDAAAVPEPGQWLLMATGLLLLGAMARRRTM
jgi:hypothetical protein